MTLSSFLTKFRSARGKLIKIKQNEKHFVKMSVKGLKMTLADWIWTIWTMFTTVALVGHLLHETLNFPSIRYIAPAKISPALLLCQKNWFCGKVTSIIFISCYVVNRSVGYILVSKEPPRPAVYTTWKIWKKTVKHNFGMKKQNRALLLGHPVSLIKVPSTLFKPS